MRLIDRDFGGRALRTNDATVAKRRKWRMRLSVGSLVGGGPTASPFLCHRQRKEPKKGDPQYAAAWFFNQC